MSEVVLSVEGLRTKFETDAGPVFAVDDVSFELKRGQALGLVGESGCGKSVSALSVLRLVPDPPGRIVGGAIRFKGRDLLTLPEAEMRGVRGNQISMIFQEPMTSLNPVFTVGEQIAEAVRLHQRASRAAAKSRAAELLGRVGIAEPQRRVNAYPHELSGGMRQRVMIAMALACDPEVLIADEPTTALDVTTQAEILELVRGLQRERDLAVLWISHDLGVVAELCSEVCVMYAGRIVERAPVRGLFDRPAHPYAEGLLRSIRELAAIRGTVPSLAALPAGCRFRDRCDRAIEVCARVDPALEPKREGQWAACHNPVPAP